MRDNALFQQRTKPMKYFVSQPTLNPVSSMIWNAFQVAHLKIVSWSDQSHLLLGVLFAHFCSYDTDLMWQDEQKTTNNGEQNTQRELQCPDQLGLWMDRWLMCGLWAAEIRLACWLRKTWYQVTKCKVKITSINDNVVIVLLLCI